MNPKKYTPGHIIVNFRKDRKKILKAGTETRLVIFRGTSTGMTVNLLSKVMGASRKWHNIFQVPKEKNCNY